MSPAYILPILRDPFVPIRCEFDGGMTDGPYFLKRSFSWKRLMVLAVLPVVVGAWLGWKGARLGNEVLPLTLAVASILAAALIGFLPLVQSITGMKDLGQQSEPGDYLKPQKKLARLAALMQLYSHIAFGIAAALFSIIPQLMLLVSDHPVYARVVSSVVYMTGILLALVLLQILCGVYWALMLQAQALIEKIRSEAQDSFSVFDDDGLRDRENLIHAGSTKE